MRNHKTTTLSDPDLSHIAEDLRPLATPITSCTLDLGNARTDHVLFATDPPYLVDYDGTNHPHKWNEDTAVAERKNKDWSDTYTDWDKQGVDLYERCLLEMHSKN